MTRIRNVLQSRADRFRRKHGKNVSHVEEKHLSIRSLPYDDETEFTGQCIIPKMDPDGAEPDVVSSDSIYSLEAKDTRATLGETFSSGDENEIFTEDQGSFVDPAYEAARQQKSSSSEMEYIDLVRESARTGHVGADRSKYTNQDEKEDAIVTNAYLQPETIEFVDSEDGQVFEIPQKEVRGHDGLIQNTSSLDDTYHDECSATLNTNHETLQTPYNPSIHDNDIGQTNSSERFRALQVHVEEEQHEEYNEEARAYENEDYDEEEEPIDQENSELYDCDDGQMYIPDPTTQGNGHVGQPYELERDGTFFEQMRSVSLRNTNDYQIHPEHLEMEPQNWQAITQQIHSEHPENAHLNSSNHAPASPQLEDPYLSDSNSSWEEGSFGTGASRAVSRVDHDDDDDDDDDDAGTYDGTFDGTEYYSDDEVDRPFVRILKKFRDMHVDDQRSDYGSDDEEGYEDRKKRTRSRQERRSKSKPISVFERIGEIGIDLLNETIEHAERQDRAPRQDSANQGGTIINSIADLFSCGAPSGY